MSQCLSQYDSMVVCHDTENHKRITLWNYFVDPWPRVSQHVSHYDTMVVCLGPECHNAFHIMTLFSRCIADSVSTWFILWQYDCLHLSWVCVGTESYIPWVSQQVSQHDSTVVCIGPEFHNILKLWHYVVRRIKTKSVTTCFTLWQYGCLPWSRVP